MIEYNANERNETTTTQQQSASEVNLMAGGKSEKY